MEFYFFCFNFSLFSSLFYSFFEKNRLQFNLKFFIQVLLFSILFYFICKYSSSFGIELYDLKRKIFNYNYLFIFGIFFSLSYFFLNKENSILFKISLTSISFYTFFYFFGMEELKILDQNFESLHLLKAQNFLIGSVSFVLIMLPSRSFRFLLCILILSFLIYTVSEKKRANFNEVHQTYIPFEFWNDEQYLIEEENGVYVQKEKDKDDVYFRFTFKLIPKENLELKQKILYYISNFEFPILIKEDGFLILYELKRSFKNENQKVIFDLNTNSTKLEGPLF